MNKTNHPFNRKVGQVTKKHSLRNRWSKILQITTNPNTDGFHLYGGRGIKMCSEWKNSYNKFLLWSIQNGYKPELVLCRKNKMKDFTPENCFFGLHSHDTNY